LVIIWSLRFGHWNLDILWVTLASVHIDSYSFGQIVIDGIPYSDDVMLTATEVKPGWWRRAGHEVSLADLAPLLDPEPRRLIVGTGASGMCRLRPEIEAFCRDRGIELVVMPTAKAVAAWNALADKSDAAAALHLTC
jgi:hypothetical protein